VLVFAYDGSLNGDWVAHYAARFAANAPERRLRLLHVHEASPAPRLQERISRIDDECRVLGVAFETELVAPGDPDVAVQLLERVPQGATLIVGTRARQRNSRFLAGTVAERLLEAGRFPVIAIRVVHPGVLGQPGNVLLPLAARSPSATHALFLLRLLGPDLQRVHVLFLRELPRLHHRILGGEGARRRLAEGRAFVAPVQEALRTSLAPHRFQLDSSVVASDDPSREVLLHAARYRSRLICLDAAERTSPSRLFRRDPIERVLRDTPSDVAVYRSLD
jgi:nucleotide-binding universal stress UspA family protein